MCLQLSVKNYSILSIVDCSQIDGQTTSSEYLMTKISNK